MKVSDIMTSPVITVGPNTPVRDVAGLLYENRISAVPVLESGRLVGLVSEGDLLHRHEIGTDHNAPAGAWWRRLFERDRSPAEYIKSHAKRARDVMTRQVVSIASDAPLAEAADLFAARGIKRVPVMRRGELVGIVSRADLVRALARMPATDSAAR
jgi:CBS domain-containing protein